METIRIGMQGAAVEDVQARLERLGYEVDAVERAEERFGEGTAESVRRFRCDHDLGDVAEVDQVCWSALVSESYELGDRTLYLRLPNFHGRDVRTLQLALNVLGFNCGEADGYFDAHTEAAVKEFQENVGLFPDGMCFTDTFEAIWHLHHVWGDEKRRASRTLGFIGFARAASVLEDTVLCLTGDDPISRNVAGRVWNLASATSERSGLALLNDISDAPADATCIFEITCTAPSQARGIGNVTMTSSPEELALRLRTAVDASTARPPHVFVELPFKPDVYGRFTIDDAQMLAATLLDALCSAFAGRS